MAHDVFICHSSQDQTIANAICSKLEQNRIRCWMAPRDIVAGTEWGESIIEAINGSKLTVLVFTDHSNQSKHVHKEIERTVNRGIPVLPFRVDDVVPSPSLEYFISDAHWLDAMTAPMEEHLDHLVGTVRVLLERASAAAAPKESGAASVGTTALLEAPPAPPSTAQPRAPMPPGGKRPKWLPWAIIGAIVAVAAVVIGVLAIGGGSKTGNSPGTGSSAAPTASASPPGAAPVKLGTPISLTGIDSGTKAVVTAVTVVDPTTSNDEQPKAGDRFVAVQFTIRNTGTGQYEDAFDNCGTLVAANGHAYSASPMLSVAAGPVFEASVTLNPGEAVSGYAVFDVPKATKITQIRFALDSGVADQVGAWSVG